MEYLFCENFFAFPHCDATTMWKLRNCTATIFSQKFRESIFLLKRTLL